MDGGYKKKKKRPVYIIMIAASRAGAAADLLHAVRTRDVRMTEFLLVQHSDVINGGVRAAALQAACKTGEVFTDTTEYIRYVDVARLLIEHGIDMCAVSQWYPQLLADYAHVDVYRLLVENNVDIKWDHNMVFSRLINEVDQGQVSSRSQRHIDMCRLLIQYGADVNVDTARGAHTHSLHTATPMEVACRVGNIALARMLICAGARVNEKCVVDAYVSNEDLYAILAVTLTL